MHIYSTLTADNNYTGYIKTEGNDLPIVGHQVLVKGGTNVADKRFVTPIGVHTEVSPEDYEHLLNNSVFQLHMKNGFVKTMDKKYDPEKVAADMNSRDKSAPIVPGDYKDDKQPRVGDGANAKK